MEKQLQGMVVLVTGAGSGLGQATARACARAGCRVACLDVNLDAVERVCAQLEAEHCEGMALQCDVSDAGAIFQAVDDVVQRFDRLDSVINCAGVDHTYGVEDLTVEQWDQELAVNLRAPFLFAKAAFPLMRRRRSGHIVNIASTAASRAWANATPYHASEDVVAHLRLPDEAFDRIEHEYFETGHMPYLHEPSRKRELGSITAFVERR